MKKYLQFTALTIGCFAVGFTNTTYAIHKQLEVSQCSNFCNKLNNSLKNAKLKAIRLTECKEACKYVIGHDARGNDGVHCKHFHHPFVNRVDVTSDLKNAVDLLAYGACESAAGN